jgi:hypothetical protein
MEKKNYNEMVAELVKIGSVKDLRTANPAYTPEVQAIMKAIYAAMGFTWEEVALEVGCPNGYAASIARNPGTYGAADGRYEVAVYRNGTIVYDTPVTDDVLGNLTESEVVDAVRQIAAL